MMARELSLPVMGVIENMSWFTGNDGERYELFGAGGGVELAEKLGTQLLARIPLAPVLREGGDIGQPVVVASPESEVAFVFEELALQIHKMGPRRIYREELQGQMKIWDSPLGSFEIEISEAGVSHVQFAVVARATATCRRGPWRIAHRAPLWTPRITQT